MELFKVMLSWLFRITLAIIFIWAGIEKLLRPNEFFEAVENYQIIHGKLALFVAYMLPPLEITCGLALLTRRYMHAGLILAALMIVVFIIAIFSAWMRGLDINCGCFGGGDSSSYAAIIFRDFVLLLITGWIYFTVRYRQNSKIAV